MPKAHPSHPIMHFSQNKILDTLFSLHFPFHYLSKETIDLSIYPMVNLILREFRLFPQSGVRSVEFDQFVVRRGAFNDGTFIDHGDGITVAYGRQPVCNDHRRLIRHHLVKAVLYHAFTFRVQGTGGT